MLCNKFIEMQFLIFLTIFLHVTRTDEIKFGVNRLMKKTDSEDEDNNNTYHEKSLLVCVSPSDISVTRTKSRSRSRSRSRSGTRSRSSSPELEVDSPPPPRICSSPITDIPLVSLQNTLKSLNFNFKYFFQPKKSEAFSVSALLRDDQPKSSKSPTSSSNSFENIR